MRTEPGAGRTCELAPTPGSTFAARSKHVLEEAFRGYLEDYFAYYSDLTFRDFKRSQRGMAASLAFGAAGIAFAHWYAAARTGADRSNLLPAAERWIASARRAGHGALAYTAARITEGPGIPSGAVFYGEAGIWLVSALVARSSGRRTAERRAIGRWDALSAGPDAPCELYNGVAGSLVAATILVDRTGDLRAARRGRELAGRLAAQVVLGPGDRVCWPGCDGSWLAHGTAGPLLASVLWCRATGAQAPAWLLPSIGRLLKDALADPDRVAPRAAERAWLCRGYSGLAHLALQTGRAFSVPDFLPAARRAIELSLAHPSDQADLCCGSLAVAAVCLEMAREERDGPWRAHAERAITSALLLDREEWEVAGLYGGEAALPCLVLDALEGAGAGPPGLVVPSDLIPAREVPPHRL